MNGPSWPCDRGAVRHNRLAHRFESCNEFLLLVQIQADRYKSRIKGSFYRHRRRQLRRHFFPLTNNPRQTVALQLGCLGGFYQVLEWRCMTENGPENGLRLRHVLGIL